MSNAGKTVHYEYAEALLPKALLERATDKLGGNASVITFGALDAPLGKSESRLGGALAHEVRHALLERGRIGAKLYFRGAKLAERQDTLARAGWLIGRGHSMGVVALVTGYSRAHLASQFKAVVSGRRPVAVSDPDALHRGLAHLLPHTTPSGGPQAGILALAKQMRRTSRVAESWATRVGLALRDLESYTGGEC